MATCDRVLIAIPAYNHPEWTERCVATLLETDFEDLNVEVAVLDNGSKDRWEPNDHPVTYEYVDENLRYTGGINRMVSRLWRPGTYLLTLNNDTAFHHTVRCWLPWLVESLVYLRRWDHAGAVGPVSNYVMVDQQALRMENGKRAVVDPLCRATPGMGTRPVRALCGFATLYHPDFVAARLEACGEFMADALRELGADDLDLSLWARKEGWPLFVHDGVYVFHDDRDEGSRWYTGDGKEEKARQEIDRRFGSNDWRSALHPVLRPGMKFRHYVSWAPAAFL